MATYKYECVVEDIRKVDVQEQQRRDEALSKRVRKIHPTLGGVHSAGSPGALFNMVYL